MDVLEACKDPSVVDQVVLLHIRMYMLRLGVSPYVACACSTDRALFLKSNYC